MRDLWAEDDGARDGDKGDGNVAKILRHADAHGGADPASDGVDPTGAMGSVGKGGGAEEERGIGDEGDGVERDADGIEERGEQSAVGVEQEKACDGESEEGGAENDADAATPEQERAGDGCGEVKAAVQPEMRGTYPCASFEGGGALDDEEGGGVKPDKSGEAGEDDGEGKSAGGWGQCGLRLRCRLHGTGDADSEEAEQAEGCGDERLRLRRRCEDRREVADEVAEACAETDLEDWVGWAEPRWQVGDEGYGEQAEAGADEKGDGEAGEEIEWKQGEKRGGGAEDEGGAQASGGAERWGGGLKACGDEAEEDAADGHGGHDQLEVRVRDAEGSEAMEEGELREDEEVDVGDRDEADTSPTGCELLKLRHASTIRGQGRRTGRGR